MNFLIEKGNLANYAEESHVNNNRIILVSIFRFVVKVWFVSFMVSFVACGSLNNITSVDGPCEKPLVIDGAANVSLFLNVIRRNSAPNLNVKISSIELLIDDLWVSASSGLIEVNSSGAISIQKFLGRQWIKGRYCRGVRIKIAAATSSRNNVDQVLSINKAESVVMLQNQISLEADSRKVLLVDWDSEKSLNSSGFEGMALTVYEGGVARATANLAYVACPEIDTVYVVRTDKYQVVDAFVVKGQPTYLAVDPDNKKIYVLVPSLNKIAAYDIYTHLLVNEIKIPLANLPIFMSINIRTQTAYVLDAQGVVTSVDLANGNMLRRNRVGNGPNFLYYIVGLEKLAVSSNLDHTVFLVNPDSLSVEDNISLGSAPLGLVSLENYLYIAEGSTNTVSVYDLSARKMLKNINVGFEPARLVTNDGSVFVTTYLDGSISIIQGGQFSVTKEVVVGKSPREMAVSEKQRLVLVGAGDCDGSLAIVDTTGNHVIGRIELGTKPMGIDVVD